MYSQRKQRLSITESLLIVILTSATLFRRTNVVSAFVQDSCRCKSIKNTHNNQCSLLVSDAASGRAGRIFPTLQNYCNKGSDSNTAIFMAPVGGGGGRNIRQDEIRRKIQKLKKEGKIKKNANTSTNSNMSTSTFEKNLSQSTVVDQYADKIKEKLGKKGGYMKSGALDDFYVSSGADGTSSTKTSFSKDSGESQGDDADEDNDEDDDEYLIEKVQKKLMEKRLREKKRQEELSGGGSSLAPDIDDIAEQMERELKEKKESMIASGQSSNPSSIAEGNPAKITTGIGGSWAKNETSEVDTYRPANGGWGYFPRPKDISKAYGGGKRIGADVSTSLEDQEKWAREAEQTKERLRRYREKVGIDVQSEKDNAEEIEEALAIAQKAMQRGIYNVAVSSLEKVTQYCSTNSKVGGTLFLELAMAYEAVGRSEEAISIYNTLADSRNEEAKYNAKRLLVGIEAMSFMRDEVKDKKFSRKRASQTFIDTTGLGQIARNFDDDKIYNTAYVNLDKGGNLYKKLTVNVVRSVREARQILLKATNSGEVERQRIVQALRSINRSFDNALRAEMEENELKKAPVAVMNGVPIARQEKKASTGVDMFNLGSADAMKENLSGEWKLQLMADNKGDGVSFYDKSLAWQSLWQNDDNSALNYKLSVPASFLKLSQQGEIEFNDERRIINRCAVKSVRNGSFLTDFIGKSSGPVAATNAAQQIVSVDSELLITRLAVGKTTSYENIKDYFSVWRRVESGLYSSGQKQ